MIAFDDFKFYIFFCGNIFLSLIDKRNIYIFIYIWVINKKICIFSLWKYIFVINRYKIVVRKVFFINILHSSCDIL